MDVFLANSVISICSRLAHIVSLVGCSLVQQLDRRFHGSLSDLFQELTVTPAKDKTSTSRLPGFVQVKPADHD